MENIIAIAKEFFSTEIRFHPVYLVPFFIIAFILYLYRPDEEKTNFLAWLFPKRIYFHASHMTDIKLFILGRFLTISKLFNLVFVQSVFALIGMGIIALLFGIEEKTVTELTTSRLITATLIITITADFCVYWIHRIHHETPIIWPFHAVHHSAEVMTPITVYRKHPVYDVLSDFVKAILIGLVQGIILMLLVGKIQLSIIAGVNIFYFIFNFIGSNFRHSHIWFRYGNILEHIFISPAQHQIHHSLEPKHHNKNYGEILAIWDWLFGTLYIPESYEKLSYGISKSSNSNDRIEQPHPTLKSALIKPFTDSWKAIKRRHNHRIRDTE